MREAGAVIGKDGDVMHWHVPPNRSVGALPDSRELWDFLWSNRDRVAGFAHSHPGSGVPGPSFEDVSTFSAIELALGRRLDWWITSSDFTVVLRWRGPDKYTYGAERVADPPWIKQLRDLSEPPEVTGHPV